VVKLGEQMVRLNLSVFLRLVCLGGHANRMLIHVQCTVTIFIND
jgi:predicted DNA-binding ribbon-helix-helix protein